MYISFIIIPSTNWFCLICVPSIMVSLHLFASAHQNYPCCPLHYLIKLPFRPHYFGSCMLPGLHLLPITFVLFVFTLCFWIPATLAYYSFSFSPRCLAGYNCRFSCHFLSLHLSCCVSLSFILSCKAIKPSAISLVPSFAQELVFMLVFYFLSLNLSNFLPLVGYYPLLCQQYLCFLPNFSLCPLWHFSNLIWVPL